MTIEQQAQPLQQSLSDNEGESSQSWLPTEFQTPEQMVEAYNSLKNKPPLSFDAFTQEYTENGTLSDESYDALTQAGIPKDVADSYMEGLRLIAERQQAKVFEAVGGEKTYRDMIAWAEKNLSQDEIEAYNATLNSNNINAVTLAASGLHAKYAKTLTPEPQLLSGGAAGKDVSVFRSLAELTEAMKDPRYSKDPAYRQDVESKLARSDIL